MAATPRILRLLVVVVILLGLGVGAFALLSGKGEALSVSVRDDGKVVSKGSLADSLAEASARAGFEIVAPRDEPQGLRVHDILLHPKIQPPPGAPPSDFRVVTLQLEVSGKKFLLDELRGGFDPVLSGERLADAVADAEVYYDKTDTAVIYSMLTKGRGFILSFPSGSALDRTAAIGLLQAFADELK